MPTSFPLNKPETDYLEMTFKENSFLEIPETPAKQALRVELVKSKWSGLINLTPQIWDLLVRCCKTGRDDIRMVPQYRQHMQELLDRLEPLGLAMLVDGTEGSGEFTVYIGYNRMELGVLRDAINRAIALGEGILPDDSWKMRYAAFRARIIAALHDTAMLVEYLQRPIELEDQTDADALLWAVRSFAEADPSREWLLLSTQRRLGELNLALSMAEVGRK